MRPGSWVAATRRPAVTARNALLSPWTGCDSKGEGCGERNWCDKLKLSLFLCFSEGRKESVHHLLNERVATAGRSGFPLLQR